jgi:predicted nucleic acid-binding protein
LIDTNVISELRKGAKCNPNVAAWYSSIVDAFVSVLVLGEIRKGIERARTNDPARARVLERWLEATMSTFGDRVLPIDQAIADEWGRMSARRPVSTVDGLMAATARVHRMTLVTRNLADVADLGADVLNPFDYRLR